MQSHLPTLAMAMVYFHQGQCSLCIAFYNLASNLYPWESLPAAFLYTWEAQGPPYPTPALPSCINSTNSILHSVQGQTLAYVSKAFQPFAYYYHKLLSPFCYLKQIGS